VIIEKIPDIQSLTPKEKAILARELWADAADVEYQISGDDGHHSIIEERWTEFLRDPESALPWDEVKQKIEKRIEDDREN
jgi:putative addiction module component (TIGR02574 family)